MNYFEALYFALPVVANAAPVLVARVGLLQSLALPIDGGLEWRGRPLLGKNKTWRGVLSAIVLGSGIASLQYALPHLPQLPAPLDNSLALALGYGAFVGCLCMLGDSIESGVKRALHIKSGEPFIPFDQIDYMLAFLAGTWWLFEWSLPEALFLLMLAFFASLMTNMLAYGLGIKSTHW